jgi:hypothetical protein
MIRRNFETVLWMFIEHIEKCCELSCNITAIFFGIAFDEFLKGVLSKNRCIIGKHTEDEPDEEDLKVMTFVADVFEFVVKFSHQLGGVYFEKLLQRVILQKIIGSANQQIRRNLNDREKNKKAISFEIASVINK